MIKCNGCPRKASCTIEPSTCCTPTNYTINQPKVKTEKEIRADERRKFVEWCKMKGYGCYDWRMLLEEYEKEE